MKEYHTYSAIDVAFTLLKYADKQGKRFTNLQLQKLVYVCHGLSLAHFDRPLVMEDVCAWQYGPVIPAVYFRFKAYGAETIDERPNTAFEQLDGESERIVEDVVTSLGDFTGPQLIALTHRSDSPWHKIYYRTGEGKKAVIPDDIIRDHYCHIRQSGQTTSL